MYYQILDNYNKCQKCLEEKYPTYKVFTGNENKDVYMFCNDCCREYFIEMSETENIKYTTLKFEHEVVTRFYHNAGNEYFMPSDLIPDTQVLFKVLSSKYISNVIEFKNIYEYINEIVLSLIHNVDEFKQQKYAKGIFGLQFVFNLYKDSEVFDENQLQEFKDVYFDYLQSYH